MHLIYCYLLKDVADIVLDYVYRPDIKKLNKEYSNKVKSSRFRKESSIFRNLLFNYRAYIGIGYLVSAYPRTVYHSIYSISQIDTHVYLPNNYFYSSGCNNLNRFLNIMR